MRIAPKMRFPTCSVCNESVELETSKTDATGKAAREECYIVKVTGSGPFLPTCVVDYPASISGYERESLAAEANLAAEFGLPEYGIDRCRVVVNRCGC
jgi:hypothetical protein